MSTESSERSVSEDFEMPAQLEQAVPTEAPEAEVSERVVEFDEPEAPAPVPVSPAVGLKREKSLSALHTLHESVCSTAETVSVWPVQFAEMQGEVNNTFSQVSQ
ncbi:hypothetical protein KIPB_009606, partial [Kipferlia bialata]|eukprot:g9606.t1